MMVAPRADVQEAIDLLDEGRSPRGGRRSRVRGAAYSDGSVLPGTVCAASDTGEPTIMGE
jgi:hypothetical protein